MEQNEEVKNEMVAPEISEVKKKKRKGKAMNIIAVLSLVYGVFIGLFSLICLSSFMIPVFYYIVLFAIVVFTLGLIFVEYPNFGDKFTGDSVIIEKIAPTLMYMAPFMVGLSGFLFILSIILFSCNKKRRKKAGIIVSAVFFALYIIAVIIAVGFQVIIRMSE